MVPVHFREAVPWSESSRAQGKPRDRPREATPSLYRSAQAPVEHTNGATHEAGALSSQAAPRIAERTHAAKRWPPMQQLGASGPPSPPFQPGPKPVSHARP